MLMYTEIRIPRLCYANNIERYFHKAFNDQFNNFLAPTDDYINLLIDDVKELFPTKKRLGLFDMFKKCIVAYKEEDDEILLSDAYAYSPCSKVCSLLNPATISKAFSNLKVDCTKVDIENNRISSIWKNGVCLEDNSERTDCSLERVLTTINDNQKYRNKGRTNMTKEEDLYQTLIKLGMIDEEEMPQDLFEDTCSDLPALMSFVNDLVVNNGQDVIKQLLINLIYKK